MSLLAHNNSNELCAKCGDFVERLDEFTGWCDPCSGITQPILCERCSEPLSESGELQHLCNRCKYLIWLETNADEIERVMATQGCTAAKAKQLVRDKNRPICLSCNTPIKGGTKGRTFFCTKTAKCRKAINAYRYYRHKKNLSHDEAVQKALYTGTLFKLLNSIEQRKKRNESVRIIPGWIDDVKDDYSELK